MVQLPAKLNALLQDLTAQLPVLLGRNLVGVYLYGSVTHGAFNPKRSDVDCIVVTRRDLSDAQFRKLDAWLARAAKSNSWTARLQMLFLVKNELLIMNTSGSLYQFGVLARSGSDGNPIIWMDFLTSGRVLLGPRPESFLPEITPQMIFQAVERELGYLREEITEKPKSEWRDVPIYRAYAVLTVCRVLYLFRKNGTIVSKPRASKWAIGYLPEEWREIIRRARDLSENGRVSDIPLKRIEQFIDFAGTIIHPR